MGIKERVNVDLRTQKTYDALFSALTELLGEKPFEEITVHELCGRARVRRATFYNHFADKYAFLDFAIQTVRRKRTAAVQQQMADAGPVAFVVSLLSTALDFLEANAQTVKNLRTSNLAFLLTNLGPEELSQQLQQSLEEYEKSGYQLAGDPEILAEFLLGAIGQVGRWWLEQEGRVSKDEAVSRLKPILQAIFPK